MQVAFLGLFFCGYLIGGWIGLQISLNNIVVPLWPPSGIYLASLLLSSRRMWLPLMVTAWVGTIIINVGWDEKSYTLSSCFWLANTLEAVLGALLLRAFATKRGDFTLGRLADVLTFACAGALGPAALGGLLAAAAVQRELGGNFWEIWQIWWSGSGLGALILAPLFMCASDRRLQTPRRPAMLVEAILCWVALISLCCWALLSPAMTTGFSVFLVLLWTALRFELRGVAVANFSVAIVTLWLIVHRNVPTTSIMLSQMITRQIQAIQLFLGVTSISCLTIAAALTERRVAWEANSLSTQRYQHLIDHTSDLIAVMGIQGKLHCANNAWLTTLEFTSEDLPYITMSDLVHPEDLRRWQTCIQQTLTGRRMARFDLRLLTRSGKTIYLDGSCDARLEGGRPVEIYSIARDATARKLVERENAEYQRKLEAANATLQTLSITDGLTHLYNRRFLQQRLEEEFQRALRYESSLVVLLLDVDHFKKFNDTYGHLAGDQILIQVGEHLTASARTTDLIARYGGEEFAAILPGIDLEGGLALAERIRSSIEYGPWGQKPITVSIGAACISSMMSDPAELLQLADEALYSSKQQGRNRVTAMNSGRHLMTVNDWVSMSTSS